MIYKNNGKIEDKIGQVNQVVDLRRKKTEIYQKYLSEKYIEKPQVDDLFRWRYTSFIMEIEMFY